MSSWWRCQRRNWKAIYPLPSKCCSVSQSIHRFWSRFSAMQNNGPPCVSIRDKNLDSLSNSFASLMVQQNKNNNNNTRTPTGNVIERIPTYRCPCYWCFRCPSSGHSSWIARQVQWADAMKRLRRPRCENVEANSSINLDTRRPPAPPSPSPPSPTLSLLSYAHKSAVAVYLYCCQWWNIFKSSPNRKILRLAMPKYIYRCCSDAVLTLDVAGSKQVIVCDCASKGSQHRFGRLIIIVRINTLQLGTLGLD